MSENQLPKVLLVTNETLLAEGVCALLKDSGACAVVGSAASREEALEKTRELKPDVILMDIARPALESEQVIRHLYEEAGNVRVLLVGHDRYRESIFRGLQAGARGYVSRTDSASVLVSAIMEIYQGGYSLSPSAAKLLMDEYRRIKPDAPDDPYRKNLTDRERKVVKHLAEGHSCRAIASGLNIPLKQAVGYRANIMQKLNIRNTTELVKYAVRTRLVEL